MGAWVILLDGVIGWALMAVSNWFALDDFRGAKEAHWTERARCLWPAREGARLGQYVIPAIIGYGQLGVLGIPPWVNALGCVASFLGAILGSIGIDRSVHPALTWREWLPGALVRRTYYALLIGILILAITLMPEEGWGILIFTVGYALAAISVLLFWPFILRKLGGGIHPAGERLQRLAAMVTASMEHPIPTVNQIKSAAAAAFALPTRNEVWVSDGLLTLCDDDEVATILNHEMAHLSEPRRMTALRWIGFLAPSTFIFYSPVTKVLGEHGPLLLILPMLFLVIFRRQHRRMEIRADDRAAASQSKEGTYARALCKVYEAELIPAVDASTSATHPDLFDRMIAAGMMPDFPRPERPHRVSWAAVLSWAALLITMMMLMIYRAVTDSSLFQQTTAP